MPPIAADEADDRSSARSWARRDEVEEAILEAAAEQFLTAQQLADRLGRAVRTLRQNYLNDLVAQRKLELLYPERPTSPAQAYRTPKQQG